MQRALRTIDGLQEKRFERKYQDLYFVMEDVQE